MKNFNGISIRAIEFEISSGLYGTTCLFYYSIGNLGQCKKNTACKYFVLKNYNSAIHVSNVELARNGLPSFFIPMLYRHD